MEFFCHEMEKLGEFCLNYVICGFAWQLNEALSVSVGQMTALFNEEENV